MAAYDHRLANSPRIRRDFGLDCFFHDYTFRHGYLQVLTLFPQEIRRRKLLRRVRHRPRTHLYLSDPRSSQVVQGWAYWKDTASIYLWIRRNRRLSYSRLAIPRPSLRNLTDTSISTVSLRSVAMLARRMVCSYLHNRSARTIGYPLLCGGFADSEAAVEG